MRIYTRYQAARKRWSWRNALHLALALAGLGIMGWVIYRTSETSSQPRPVRPAPAQPTPSVRPAGQTNLAFANQPRLAAPPTNAVPPTVRVTVPSLVQTQVVVRPPPVAPAPTNAPSIGATQDTFPRPVRDTLEAQIALASRGFSCGSLDDALGYQTRAALRAFQRQAGLPVTGALETATRQRLTLATPPLTTYVVTTNDLARLRPLSHTWLGKSVQTRLDFETVLELVSERHRAHPALVRRLNPGVDWDHVRPGQPLTVPNAPTPVVAGHLAFLRIGLQDRMLDGFDARTNLLLHFPCSIASRIEKRPVGRLEVATVANDPTYTFDPEIFPESAEARHLNHKLTLPPGPNNPVGVAWIGLNRPGYGIHGTARPEDVGRTESHGCFRLANWDAALLARLVWPGLPVYVQY